MSIYIQMKWCSEKKISFFIIRSSRKLIEYASAIILSTSNKIGFNIDVWGCNVERRFSLVIFVQTLSECYSYIILHLQLHLNVGTALMQLIMTGNYNVCSINVVWSVAEFKHWNLNDFFLWYERCLLFNFSIILAFKYRTKYIIHIIIIWIHIFRNPKDSFWPFINFLKRFEGVHSSVV